MNKGKDRPGLRSRPPGPQATENFLNGAEEPRPAPAEPTPAPRREAPRQTVDAAPWGKPDGDMEKFLLRLPGELHAKLAWLSETSGPRRHRQSMNAIILDMLEPAIDEAVRRKREELGV